MKPVCFIDIFWPTIFTNDKIIPKMGIVIFSQTNKKVIFLLELLLLNTNAIFSMLQIVDCFL